MTDARVVRTRAALHRAAADLASRNAASDITVSDLALAAGINRATFYKHYDSPSDTLAAVLEQDLAESREHYLRGFSEEGADPVDTFRSSISDTLDHVERYIDVYTTAVAKPHDGVVQNLLSDYFTESAELYLRERAKHEPPMPPLDVPTVARFMGHGLTGAIKAWVLSEDRDREIFTQSILACATTWWYPER